MMERSLPRSVVKATLFVFFALLAVSIDAKQADSKLELSGQVLVDADYYSAFYDEDADGSQTAFELSQAKGTLKYQFNKHWKTKLQLKYFYQNNDKHDVELGDAYVSYNGFNIVDLSIGAMKEPFSYERLTGSSKTNGIERSMVTSAFAPGRAYGIQVSKKNKAYTWAVGIFRNTKEDDVSRSVTARATFAPLQTVDQTLHIGGAVTLRDFKKHGFQIKERGEVNTADNILRSARFKADSARIVGMELVWQHQSFTFQSELMKGRFDQINTLTMGYSGYYIQASFFATGEQPKYKEGAFKRVKPQSDIGAVELVARFSYLDIRDKELGSESDIAMVGVNYHISKQFKVMVNYLAANIRGNALHSVSSGKAVSARIQMLF